MGFDINGLNPKNKKGEYFRNNCWWWRPLAIYVLNNVNLPDEEIKYWGSNDGQVVSDESAVKIANKLNKLIKEGKTKKYEKEYMTRLNNLPDEVCKYCNGTGTRTDLGETKKCNACEGKGKVRPFEASYPFSTENVKEFAEFCANSGGFEIW